MTLDEESGYSARAAPPPPRRRRRWRYVAAAALAGMCVVGGRRRLAASEYRRRLDTFGGYEINLSWWTGEDLRTFAARKLGRRVAATSRPRRGYAVVTSRARRRRGYAVEAGARRRYKSRRRAVDDVSRGPLPPDGRVGQQLSEIGEPPRERLRGLPAGEVRRRRGVDDGVVRPGLPQGALSRYPRRQVGARVLVVPAGPLRRRVGPHDEALFGALPLGQVQHGPRGRAGGSVELAGASGRGRRRGAFDGAVATPLRRVWTGSRRRGPVSEEYPRSPSEYPRRGRGVAATRPPDGTNATRTVASASEYPRRGHGVAATRPPDGTNATRTRSTSDEPRPRRPPRAGLGPLGQTGLQGLSHGRALRAVRVGDRGPALPRHERPRVPAAAQKSSREKSYVDRRRLHGISTSWPRRRRQRRPPRIITCQPRRYDLDTNPAAKLRGEPVWFAQQYDKVFPHPRNEYEGVGEDPDRPLALTLPQALPLRNTAGGAHGHD